MPCRRCSRLRTVELGPTGSYWEEPDGSAEGGSLRAMARAGMTRECHVRIRERLGVKFPGLTRPKCECPRAAVMSALE
jgi:hypothetical protein